MKTSPTTARKVSVSSRQQTQLQAGRRPVPAERRDRDNDSDSSAPRHRRNYCYLEGNLGMDPVERASNHMTIVGFSIAENVQKYDEATQRYQTLHTNWFNVTAFGETALAAKSQLHKGDRVVIEGRMRMSKYVSKTGESRTGFEIVAEKVTPWRSPTETEVLVNDEDLPF